MGTVIVCKKIFSLSVFFMVGCISVYAEYRRCEIPDSSEIRRDLIESWFEAPLSNVRMNRQELRQNRAGDQFQIRLEESETTFTVFVSPRAELPVDVYSDKGKSTEIQSIYPGDAPGSWVLVRDKRSGSPLRVRYYFAKDSDVYVQFVPSKNNAYADFIIFGGYAVRQVPTGLPFERFYTASFTDLMSWTKNTLPWGYAYPHTNMYHSTLQMINVIRGKLPDLVYAEDAMYDENDEPVYISTGKQREIPEEDADKISLSSAGFLKWIVDGLVNPVAGSSLKREPLLIRTVDYDPLGYQGIMAEKYNTSFALDWTRNIAAAVLSVNTGRKYLYAQSGVDMTEDPFCAELTAGGVMNTVEYIKDCGYPAVVLKSLMYVFASEYPGECYLAAVLETDRRTSPEVKVFNQCAILFPYFDTGGKFNCVVFRNGEESTIDDFYRSNSSNFIHLTRMKTSDKFFPL
jgi:hypothetical protein